MRSPSGESSSQRLPVRGDLRLAYVFSLVVAVIMAIASVVGLIYRDKLYASEVMLSKAALDLFNLIVALPVLLGSIRLARRGKLSGLLCWPGALSYLLYITFANMIGLSFNLLFLAHIAIVTLSAYTTIGLMACIDGQALRLKLNGSVPARTAGGILIGLTALFIAMAIVEIVAALVSSAQIDPQKTALWITDLTLSPAWLIGGILLWRRQALGYVAGAGLLLLYSMLFVGIVFIMVFPAVVSASEIDVAGVIIMLAMGLVCFIPLVLFVRAAEASSNLSPS